MLFSPVGRAFLLIFIDSFHTTYKAVLGKNSEYDRIYPN
jgi:hypothetical protein